MRRLLFLSASFLAFGSAAQAGTIQVGPLGILTVSAQSAIGATSSPFLLDNPGTSGSGFVSNSPINIGAATVTFSPDGTSPPGGIYAGNTGSAASPFNGGPSADQTKLTPANYFVAEPKSPVTIAFNSLQTNFDLLWGTVDAYNALTIQFCLGGYCASEATVTGADVAEAVGNGFAANGTSPAFVELNEFKFAPFDEIKLTSTGVAFEFEPQYVPEPVTLSILGTGLVGLGFARRRRAA